MRAGISTKALRYYERFGLIDETDRNPNGYRDYSPDVLDRLKFIRAGQAVGLTLGEIRGIIGFRDQGAPPCGYVLDLVEARAKDLDRRIKELRRLRDELRALAHRGRTLSPEACSDDLVCHVLNPAHS